MAFANPAFLFLLPLAALPFLLVWMLRRKRIELELPSLYFASQLFKKASVRFSRKSYLETFLEALFLLVMVLLLTRPVLSGERGSKQKLLVFIDNSPSMRYTLSRFEADPLYEFLSQQLKSNPFEELLVVPLNQALSTAPSPGSGVGDVISLSSLRELRTLYTALKTWAQIPSASWQSTAFSSLTFLSESLGPLVDYEIIFYSDFKANHFSSANSPTSVFPFKAVHLFEAPSGPYLEKIALPWKNYFLSSTLPLSLAVAFPVSLKATAAQSTFLTVLLGEEVVYESKVAPSQRWYRPQLRVQQTGVVPLKVVLSMAQAPLDTFLTALFVYEPFSIALPGVANPPSPSVVSASSSLKLERFFKALFAYDFSAGKISFSTEGDFVFITDFLNFPVESVSSQKKYVVFLNAEVSLTALNQQLRQLFPPRRSRLPLQFEAQLTPTPNTAFYNLAQPGTLPASQAGVQHFFSLPPALEKMVLTYFRLDTLTAGFKLDNFFFFTFLGSKNFLLAPNPLQLAWIYEALFALSGKKIVRFLEDEVASMANGEALLKNQPASPLGNFILENETKLFLPKRNQAEFNSPSLITSDALPGFFAASKTLIPESFSFKQRLPKLTSLLLFFASLVFLFLMLGYGLKLRLLLKPA